MVGYPIRSAPAWDAQTEPDPDAGIARRRQYMVGPGAMLGGNANVIMQLSNPAVGRGVVESIVERGRYDRHPNKRARTTLTYLAVAMIGTEDDRAAYRAATNTSHRPVRSDPGSRVSYNAFDPELQLWVAACIYRGVRDYLVLFFGDLDEETADDLYRESARFGTTLQMRPEMWPADRAAFEAYWDSKLSEISLDDEVKTYLLTQVVDLGPHSRLRRLALRRVNRFFATGFLPQHFRDELDLTWSPRRQRAFEIVMRTLGRILTRLPESGRLYPYDDYLREMRLRQERGKPLV
ncbi:oxygenase MpaB family protein [Aldersonia sp. NBC_00410]|uniref:oxygenase MpaB family protein n=1 Tax=Aldersonia sp. NBC_00410 TaxID=2975954 RepID=UPI0022515B8A|nr:oxygenase MpaB family protein [Aldersonia sp. NBC_00410]MCX5042942.1 oxygenase MpaB family protein [Aldersonia sp. NBC_00410]